MTMITCLFGSSRKDGNSNIAVENLLKNLNVNFVNLYQSNIEKLQIIVIAKIPAFIMMITNKF